MSGVTLSGATYAYAGGPPVLRDLSLDIEPGTVTCCVGRVGAGCSTLLLLAAGLAPRVAGGTLQGTVRILGYDAATEEGRRALAGKVGVVFATPWTQLSGMAFTVRAEVAFGPANLGRRVGDIWEAVDRALTRVEAAHLAGRQPATLSGGELQRVIIAAALALHPSVLILDDATAELDAAAAARVWRIAREEAAAGGVVLMASTDLDRAAEFADRIVLMRNGRVAAAGSPGEVLAREIAWSEGGPGSTGVAEVLRAARFPAPYPLTVADALDRLP